MDILGFSSLFSYIEMWKITFLECARPGGIHLVDRFLEVEWQASERESPCPEQLPQVFLFSAKPGGPQRGLPAGLRGSLQASDFWVAVSSTWGHPAIAGLGCPSLSQVLEGGWPHLSEGLAQVTGKFGQRESVKSQARRQGIWNCIQTTTWARQIDCEAIGKSWDGERVVERKK